MHPPELCDGWHAGRARQLLSNARRPNACARFQSFPPLLLALPVATLAQSTPAPHDRDHAPPPPRSAPPRTPCVTSGGRRLVRRSPLYRRCRPASPPPPGTVETALALRYIDIQPGTGAPMQPGDFLTVHYTGWLASTGEKFDSSLDRNEPFTFQQGEHHVIPGWDDGLNGMRVGGKRRLFIPLAAGLWRPGPRAHPPECRLDLRRPTAGSLARATRSFGAHSAGNSARVRCGTTAEVKQKGRAKRPFFSSSCRVPRVSRLRRGPPPRKDSR